MPACFLFAQPLASTALRFLSCAKYTNGARNSSLFAAFAVVSSSTSHMHFLMLWFARCAEKGDVWLVQSAKAIECYNDEVCPDVKFVVEH